MFQAGSVNLISRRRLAYRIGVCLALSLIAVSLSGGNPAFAAENEQLKTAAAFKPSQQDVEYDQIDSSKLANYKLSVERQGKTSGYVLTGSGGLPLRRFVDSNGDNTVDQWRFYQNGIEVYRDLDTNFNSKIDQFRWLNSAGSRWGVDTNEDGKIDAWKSISAEEASREAVRALAKKDTQILNLILLNQQDLEKLALPESLAAKLKESISGAEEKLAKAASAKGISPKMNWMRFDSPMPCAIPAQQDGLKSDLLVYENAMAIVDQEGKGGFVHLGELIQVGDAWKLARVPSLMEGESMQLTDSGLFFTTNTNRESSDTPQVDPGASPEIQKLIERLQKLDEAAQAGNLSQADSAKNALERADVIEELLNLSKTEAEQEQWARQLVDGINAAIQSGDYSKGFERLEALQKRIQAKSPKSPMIPYIQYRRMVGDYTTAISEADNTKRAAVQERFMKDLEQFVKNYPQSEDSPQAALQLAVTHEFNGKQKEAQQWYARLAAEYKDSPEGQKADGALARLDLKGRVLDLSGAGLNGQKVDLAAYRGQVVLVFFWATWCVPCTDDLPKIRDLYEQYHPKGFEIVGVNLDSTTEGIEPYLTQHKVTWPQIHEPGGLETSPAAVKYGIATVPTMFLVDKTGKVLSRALTLPELKGQLESLLK